jgi:hypothetical protein
LKVLIYGSSKQCGFYLREQSEMKMKGKEGTFVYFLQLLPEAKIDGQNCKGKLE